MTQASAYEQLIAWTRQAGLLGGTLGILGWDQEVMMPPGGVAYRSEQMAVLATLVHERRTSPQVGEWLEACEADGVEEAAGDPPSDAAVNVRELRHGYDRATKVPSELISEIARTTSQAKHAWQQARRDSDFAQFRPWLEKIIELKRREAECYGWAEDGEPWDALADGYEKGMTARNVAEVFTPLRAALREVIDRILGASRQPSDAFTRTKLPIDQQLAFVREISQAIGFDFQRGRLDQSTHPFCSGTHPGDVRMTTRFHEDNLGDALGSTMHETGHGIYNQGLPIEHLDTPRGKPVGLSIHESQSRLWENQVGRSEPFWNWCIEKLREHFGDAVAHLSQRDCYESVNLVKPDFIRVEADEVTYNMHIMIRFELERLMLKGDLSVADLPGAWNEAYSKDLNVDVPNDAKGCLQDIHWSMGALGYFPTYTLGNLCAAQFFEKALADMTDLYGQFERGEFAPLKQWLNEHIHSQGMRYRTHELVEQVTGEPLSHEPLLRHLKGKFETVYGLA